MSDESTTNVKQLTFDYIKSSNFRVIHADGAIGGVTPRGDIHVAFFNEREAIPTRMVFEISENGNLGKEIEEQRVKRDGFVREMDVDVILSVTVAEALVIWLSEQIVIAKEHNQRKSEIKSS